jgi:hypothetical protein
MSEYDEKTLEKMWCKNPRNLVAAPLSDEHLNAVKCVYKYLSPTSWNVMKSSIGGDGYIVPEDPFNLVDAQTMAELKSALDTVQSLKRIKVNGYSGNGSYIIDDCTPSFEKDVDLKNYPHFGCICADITGLSVKIMSLKSIVNFNAGCTWPTLNRPNWGFVMPGGWFFCVPIEQIEEVHEYVTPSLASILNTRPLSYKALGDIALVHKYLSPLEPNRLHLHFNILYDRVVPNFKHSSLSETQKHNLVKAMYTISYRKNTEKCPVQLSDEFKAQLPSYVVKCHESNVYAPCDLKSIADIIRQPNLTPELQHSAVHMKFGFMMSDGRFTRIFTHQILTLFDATYGMHSDAELDAIDTVDRYRLSGVGGKFKGDNLSVDLLQKSENQWKSLMMAMNLTIPDIISIKYDDLPLMPSYGVLLATDNSFVKYELRNIVDRTGTIGDRTGQIRPFDRSGIMLANGRFIPIAPQQILALYHKKLLWPAEPTISAESRKRAASIAEDAAGVDAKKRIVGTSTVV